MRRIISYTVFCLILKALGNDFYERGGWLLIILGFAIWLIVGSEGLHGELKQNKELKQELATDGDLGALSDRWHTGAVRRMRISSIPLTLVGIFILIFGLMFPGLDLPNWLGAIVVVGALTNLLFAKKLAEKPEVEPLIKNIIPPGFKANE